MRQRATARRLSDTSSCEPKRIGTSRVAAIWNGRYRRPDHDSDVVSESWLERWRWFVDPRKGRALDIGCGTGHDAEVLTRWGFRVTAVDISEVAIARSRARNPGVIHRVLDARDLPILFERYRFVLANLSLHYFDRSDTRRIFGSIENLLEPRGVFVFRVNAYDDVEFGAQGGAAPLGGAWECVKVGGVPKQFFTEGKLAEVLAGARWRIVYAEKLAIHRYGQRKSVFEVVVQKSSRESR